MFRRIFDELGRRLRNWRVMGDLSPMDSSIRLATINAESLKARCIVQNGKDGQYRAIGYDLSIGHIVRPDGELATRYTLPAQGIVEVISRERLHMPPNVYANVLIKTGLSNEGLLALGIGVVDPGYHGRISSFIVNFSKDTQPLELGQSFLRSVFYEVEKSSYFCKIEVKDKDYIASSRKRVISNFGDSFLNSDKLTNEIVDKSIQKYKKSASFWIPAVAFGLALITFLLNFGSFAAMQRWFDPRVEVSTTAEADIAKSLTDISDRLERLEARAMTADQIPADEEPYDD